MEANDGPLGILKLALEANVEVTLRDSDVIYGKLKSFDEHLNILLTNAQENSHNHDILFIRGDLVKLIRPSVYIA
ncbi:unnamed protein product [Blepharisma stoltei]|uniref:Sm domain-containing protein n=1 Tax=Blepharisma stoltei TaxID=1481888 RepID=A0AAU9IKN9_9CILI|nr:unnamed protein product [Blepharisma stoltei]